MTSSTESQESSTILTSSCSPKLPKQKPHVLPNTEPAHRRQIPRSHTAESGLRNSLRLASLSPSPSRSESATNPLFFLAKNLLGIDQGPTPDALEDAWSVATKRRGVYNLVQVPTRLEPLMTLGQLICLDEFLMLFTYLPVRAALSFFRLINPYSGSFTRSSSRAPWYRTCCITWAVDVLQLSLLFISSLALWFFDISWIYHNIRGQSVIKLYVVFNVIEIFDRLCSSFGIDVLDSLGWTTSSAVQFFTRDHKDASSGAMRARALQGIVLLSRMAFDYLFALIYILIHATLLLTWVVTLNVAINTQNNALLTLLVSNNFVELKGAVFKSFKVQNLFQIACSDAVERFQLCIFLLVMMIVTKADEKLFKTFFVILACEIIVDWIKHAFVTKFNRISPNVYRQFLIVICEDLSQSKSLSVVRSIGGSGVAKRIGFVNLPLAALVSRMCAGSVLRLPKIGIIFLWMTLVSVKTALSISLIGHSWRYIRKSRYKAEETTDRDDDWVQKLMQVERYDLISKNS
ncbi:Eukaryotic membrane protein Tapt1 [Gracilaria domingensis]|nr:Eukaryotic membrane protein Tapt1 [Gracilaria domingensis]